MDDQYFNVSVRSNKPGGDIRIVDFQGELDVTTLATLRSVFDDLFENKFYRLVINFSGVRYVDSTIFGLMVNKLKTCRHNFGDIKVYGLNTQLVRIFRVLGGMKIFKVYGSEEEATKDFD